MLYDLKTTRRKSELSDFSDLFRNHFRVPSGRLCSLPKNEKSDFLDKMITGGWEN